MTHVSLTLHWRFVETRPVDTRSCHVSSATYFLFSFNYCVNKTRNSIIKKAAPPPLLPPFLQARQGANSSLRIHLSSIREDIERLSRCGDETNVGSFSMKQTVQRRMLTKRSLHSTNWFTPFYCIRHSLLSYYSGRRLFWSLSRWTKGTRCLRSYWCHLFFSRVPR